MNMKSSLLLAASLLAAGCGEKKPQTGGNLLTNPGAESATSGWVGYGFSVKNTDPKPHTGNLYFFAGGSNHARLSQVIELAGSEFSATWLDSGKGQAKVSAYLCSKAEGSPDEGQISVRFESAEGTPLGKWEGPVVTAPAWQRVEGAAPLPKGTRKIIFEFTATMRTGPENDAYLDDAFVELL
jgi:hypothetical protein